MTQDKAKIALVTGSSRELGKNTAMTAIPSTVKLTSYAGGVENLMKVHPN